MQYLLSVIHNSTNLASDEEMAAIDVFNERLQSGGNWVFAGGLTNVETHLTVRDTLHSAAVFQRTNPLNQAFAPILSIDAFDTCP